MSPSPNQPQDDNRREPTKNRMEAYFEPKYPIDFDLLFHSNDLLRRHQIAEDGLIQGYRKLSSRERGFRPPVSVKQRHVAATMRRICRQVLFDALVPDHEPPGRERGHLTVVNHLVISGSRVRRRDNVNPGNPVHSILIDAKNRDGQSLLYLENLRGSARWQRFNDGQPVLMRVTGRPYVTGSLHFRPLFSVDAYVGEVERLQSSTHLQRVTQCAFEGSWVAMELLRHSLHALGMRPRPGSATLESIRRVSDLDLGRTLFDVKTSAGLAHIAARYDHDTCTVSFRKAF